MAKDLPKDLPKYLDKTLTLAVRKLELKKSVEKMMNPDANFDPDNFDPIATPDEKEVSDRARVVPPQTLPTFGIRPKEIREGQMIGMYESKQDLYLIFAHRCNDLQNQIDELKKLIK
jgi:hypothetical protein